MAEEANSRQIHEGGFGAAQGCVRDGLASLRNLETLLKSPRIGPRALEKVVAEMGSESGPLGDAFLLLIDLVGLRNPSLDVACMREFTRARSRLMDEAISQAVKSDMGAKARLQLEAKIVLLVAELDALRDLIDLLDAATRFVPTELDGRALVMEAITKMTPSVSSSVSSSVSKQSLRVMATAPEDLAVVTDARVMMPLIALGVGLIHKAGVKAIQVKVEDYGTGGVLVTCRECIDGQSGVPCVPPRIIETSLTVACNAARMAEATFEFDESQPQVGLYVQPGRTSQMVVKSANRT